MGECIVITKTWLGTLVGERKSKTAVILFVKKISPGTFLSELIAVLTRSCPHVLF